VTDRQPLLTLLDLYLAENPEESQCVARVRALVLESPDCFLRSCLPGHVTASAWIVSSDRERFLLTHHRKLGRWLQLGGHADGDSDVFAVALREAREESGMAGFEWICGPLAGSPPGPIDIDVHAIPARGDEPAHEHHDVRFLLAAHPGQHLVISDESNALEWFSWDRLERDFAEGSLLRLGRKARALVARQPVTRDQ
jgi:8-oxo-dGTP pyrophosphatase MutT (NUDIX family)